MTSLAPLLETFFTERLQRQRQCSAHTIAAYRDAFRLLLAFGENQLGKAPSDLLLADIDASLVGAFLDHIEKQRGNGARTRNARLAAIRSFFRFAAFREPTHAALIQRVLAIPQKRFDRDLITFLTRPEVDALLAAPERKTWLGRRDQALLLVAVRTGLRVSELTAFRVDALRLRLSEPSRRPTQHRRGRAASHQARRDCHARLRDARTEERDTAPPAPHDCGALARSRRRPCSHRPLARPRERRDHAGLPRRRPRDEGTRPRSYGAAPCGRLSIQANGLAPRLPGGALIMPRRTRSPPTGGAIARGIIHHSA